MCHTCNRTSSFSSFSECQYNTVEFSKDSEYYLHTCAGPDIPQVTFYTKNGDKVLTWTNNEELASYMSEKLVPEMKKMEFNIADGFKAKVMLRLPPNMDTSGNTKYPMLVNV